MSELYVERSRKVAYRRLGAEIIIMSASDSMLFSLNEVASVIWEAADGATPLSAIVRDEVCEQFEIGIEQAQHDAEEFARSLAEAGILLVSERPRVPSDSPAEKTA